MEMTRLPSGLPPTARDEQLQRLKDGRNGDPTGRPGPETRTAERRSADRVITRPEPRQTVESVDRPERSDRAEVARDTAAKPSVHPERGARLDITI